MRYRFSKRNERIMTLHLSGRTHKRIGQQFGISLQRIDQIVLKDLSIDKLLTKITSQYIENFLPRA